MFTTVMRLPTMVSTSSTPPNFLTTPPQRVLGLTIKGSSDGNGTLRLASTPVKTRLISSSSSRSQTTSILSRPIHQKDHPKLLVKGGRASGIFNDNLRLARTPFKALHTTFPFSRSNPQGRSKRRAKCGSASRVFYTSLRRPPGISALLQDSVHHRAKDRPRPTSWSHFLRSGLSSTPSTSKLSSSRDLVTARSSLRPLEETDVGSAFLTHLGVGDVLGQQGQL
jgi:hypothetical protein